jgi:RNA polymerase sigma factor (sigma-70 family)
MTHEEELVKKAQDGDKVALGELVNLVKDLVYNLAVRMLGSPADAEDAAQEILIRVVTHLSSFRGESRFQTWVYRVASNHLLTTRKRAAEERTESLEQLSQRLADGLVDRDPPIEDQLLLTEAKLVCSSNMLLGLDREHRLAFILGEVLELDSEEGAAVAGIGSDAFRKRLSRARERMAAFTEATCGIVNPERPCRCGKQMAHVLKVGKYDPAKPIFVQLASRPRAQLEAIDGIARALTVLRSHPEYSAPESITSGLRKLIASSTLGA